MSQHIRYCQQARYGHDPRCNACRSKCGWPEVHMDWLHCYCLPCTQLQEWWIAKLEKRKASAKVAGMKFNVIAKAKGE
jgi:hypothetical protein